MQWSGFVSGEVNRGVPAAWNQIARRANGDVVLMLNDDVRPVKSGWFDNILSVFDLNSTLGIAYWCQKQVNAASGTGRGFTPDSRYIVESRIRHPLLRSNFCGAFFAFRKSFWKDVKQPDGSVGFWEDLQHMVKRSISVLNVTFGACISSNCPSYGSICSPRHLPPILLKGSGRA